MKKISVMIITLILILALSANAWGISFGARAAGMGGAFTAVADDCSAVYWNPAGITQLKVLTITPGFGSQGNTEQIQTFLDVTQNSDLDTTMELFDNLKSDGLTLGASGYLGLTTKYFGVNAFFDMNAIMKQESVLNKTYTEANGYGVGTIAMTFGPLAIGGNIKLVQSSYSKSVIPALDVYDYQEIIDNWDDYDDLLLDPNLCYSIDATGTGLAFDVGGLFVLTNGLKIGFTGRNIISSVRWEGSTTRSVFNNDPIDPGFVEQPAEPFTDNKPLSSTYTLGVALRPTGSTLIAGDVEMITNPIDASFNQTRYHVGLEQTALWKTVALRLGAFSNPGETIGLSAGVGFKLGPVLVDAAMTTVGQSSGFYLTGGFKF